ncbi:hypothetical protein A4A49_14500 [Nicotiana attenuata]|uniref:Uncharacterized protein n=1 Tax=Nicotiana attenuata TaxID=49451 RepID=A0A1J6J411_NICAT|nr:hypothetical protein A4A49_14500 [Nicotiana attenuata]
MPRVHLGCGFAYKWILYHHFECTISHQRPSPTLKVSPTFLPLDLYSPLLGEEVMSERLRSEGTTNTVEPQNEVELQSWITIP